MPFSGAVEVAGVYVYREGIVYGLRASVAHLSDACISGWGRPHSPSDVLLTAHYDFKCSITNLFLKVKTSGKPDLIVPESQPGFRTHARLVCITLSK
jgi:hypothetical protein